MPLPERVRYIVADTETTDADEGRRACEVGWVEIDEDFNILERVEAIIDPERLINPSASGIHGLTNLMCESAPTIEEFFSMDADGCYGRPIEGPIVLIGHKIAFDRPMLDPFVTRAPGEKTGIVQELCTLRWARRLYPYADDHKLSTLLYSLNLETPEGPRAMAARQRYDGGHRVIGDILIAKNLAKHACERMGVGLRELAEMSAEKFYVEIMPLGKHKGDPMSQVPKSYLRWMLGNMEMDPDLHYTVETTLNKKNNNE